MNNETNADFEGLPDANEDEDLGCDDKEDGDYSYEDDEDEDEENPHTRMPKAGWSETTVQTDAMARLGICVDSAARVIVCITCASAVKPLELPVHLSKRHHPISTSLTYSQELLKTYDLRPDLDSRPGTIVTAIYGLKVIGGYQTCDTCGYGCKSDKAMSRHMKKGEDCKTSRARPVQTFRPSSKQYFFGVNLEPERAEGPTDTSLDALTYLKKKFAPIAFSEIPIKSPTTARDANHFLSMEKWDLYVKGKTGAEITDAVRDREPELRDEVRICVERFAADVAVKLGNVDHEVRAAMADYIG